jgi:hypothetical protein
MVVVAMGSDSTLVVEDTVGNWVVVGISMGEGFGMEHKHGNIAAG